MSITITVSDHLQISGANAAWIAANNAGQPDAGAYLQAVIEDACKSYASQFSVDRVSSGEFVLRFDPAEFAAVTEASKTDEHIAGFLAATRAKPTVRLADEQTVQSLDYLVSVGLLTRERANKIAFFEIPVKSQA